MSTIATNEAYRLKALEIALSYVGQKEEPAGSNAGEFVEACLKLVYLGKGFPWCNAYAYRCYREAAIATGMANKAVRTASVLNAWNLTPAERRILKADANALNILPGYQGIMDYGKGKGHTYIVIRVEGNIIHTVEGNTDANGSRTGGMVCIRTRSLADKLLKGFIIH